MLVEINQQSNYYKCNGLQFWVYRHYFIGNDCRIYLLRLRGILEKKTGYEAKAPKQFKEVIQNINVNLPKKSNETFDEKDQKEFLKGAKIAYETIITDFSDNDNKITTSKPLLNQEI